MIEGGGSKFFKPVMSTYQPVLLSSQLKQAGFTNETGFKEFFLFDSAGGVIYDSSDAQFVSLDAAGELVGKRGVGEGKSVMNLRYSNNQLRHSFGASVAVRQQNASK